MKKIYLFLIALLFTVTAGAQTTIKGDVNGDGEVNIADVTEVVNIILNPDSDDDTPTMTTGEAIDLGLSVKWASCNVGATQPWEYGGYYAWGETEEKSEYSWNTYKYGQNSEMPAKYCTTDNKRTLEPGDDVATVKWGGTWRMPTTKEQQELIYNCTWQWTTLNGVNGYRITGPNGNSIFLPAAGYIDGTEVYEQSSDGYYWSGALYSINNFFDHAYILIYSGGDYYSNSSMERNTGLTVRPVCK